MLIHADDICHSIIQGINHKRMSNRYFQQPRYMLSIISEILQIEIMTGINPKASLTRSLGCANVGCYGSLSVFPEFMCIRSGV